MRHEEHIGALVQNNRKWDEARLAGVLAHTRPSFAWDKQHSGASLHMDSRRCSLKVCNPQSTVEDRIYSPVAAYPPQ